MCSMPSVRLSVCLCVSKFISCVQGPSFDTGHESAMCDSLHFTTVTQIAVCRRPHLFRQWPKTDAIQILN